VTDPNGLLLARAIYALNGRLFNPTRRWPPSAMDRLELDLAAGTLDGIPLGGPLEALRPLGPATGLHRIGRQGFDLHFGRLGLEVGFWEGEIVDFRFVMAATAWFPPTAFAPASLRVVVPGGQAFVLGPETSERALGDWLGPPEQAEDVDVYGPSRSLTFQAGRCCVEVFADRPSGRVVDLEVCERADPRPS
jgi:hypothetical protein